MQHNNQHTDKKLQDLENQALPDLSKMEEHWQQLKTNLQPGAATSSSSRKYLRWTIAAIFIGVISLLAYTFVLQPRKKTKSSPAQKHVATSSRKKNTTTTKPNDTLPAVKKPIAEKNTLMQNSSIKPSPKKVKLQSYPVSTIDSVQPKSIVVPVEDSAAAKAGLEKFFKQLEKEEQQFVIDNKRDTLIIGKEGSALLIPAYTFGHKDVQITLREFYSYEDIITNKLTTSSFGRQLITGGMIHVSASIDGKPVDIPPGKSIRWFVPDTTKEMQQMQLFTGTVKNTSRKKLNDFSVSNDGDTTEIGGINWEAQQIPFGGSGLHESVKVLDTRDLPDKVRNTKQGKVGIFRMDKNSKLSKQELIDLMKEKYGYDKVKIRRDKSDKGRSFAIIFPRKIRFRSDRRTAIGDSSWMDPATARRFNMQATDTILSTQPGEGRYDFEMYYTGDLVLRPALVIRGKDAAELAKRFSVDVRTLGWINCDRFYEDTRAKINYYVDLPGPADNYYTMLVFERMRSMMPGYASGNKVKFISLPEGEPVKVISIGIQNGKTVAAVETVTISKTPLSSLKFEETTPAAFKENMKELNSTQSD